LSWPTKKSTASCQGSNKSTKRSQWLEIIQTMTTRRWR